MALGSRERKEWNESSVAMALAAVEGNPNPLDVGMRSIDPAPTSLDLDGCEQRDACSNSRCSRPAADLCILCGQASDEE